MTPSDAPRLHVALFRNLNLGHKGSPTKDELLSAFDGALRVRSFQTNGTVIFSATSARATCDQALHVLRARGFEHPVMLRTIEEVAEAVAATPAADPAEGVHRSAISFFDTGRPGARPSDAKPSDAGPPPDLTLPLRGANGLVELRRLDRGSASTVCWMRRGAPGDVTGFLERLLGVPVTTRTLGTLQRLLKAAAEMG
ncbi:DUF1697 domain-containing protein [Amaricoccus sp. W119]|uniref:DUF1697 domain-containing protein n=1 Tax=Amaricoccus sp. W119 TaxID=3391833 RepID=UPI0039A41C50